MLSSAFLLLNIDKHLHFVLKIPYPSRFFISTLKLLRTYCILLLGLALFFKLNIITNSLKDSAIITYLFPVIRFAKRW